MPSQLLQALENFSLPPSSGRGRSVVILGAGIAGLISAYELQRAGYRVSVLEVRDGLGGRAWTIRGGDRIVQTGRPDQLATFDPGLYFNAGAARLPSTHRLMLSYARRFGVQLEPFINVNRNAGWDFGGKVNSERRMVEDLRAHVAELLEKTIDRKALDGVVPKDEVDAVRQFLAPYADVGADGLLAADGALWFPGRGRRLQSGTGSAPAARSQGTRALTGGDAPLPVRAYLGHAGHHAPAGRPGHGGLHVPDMLEPVGEGPPPSEGASSLELRAAGAEPVPDCSRRPPTRKTRAPRRPSQRVTSTLTLGCQELANCVELVLWHHLSSACWSMALASSSAKMAAQVLDHAPFGWTLQQNPSRRCG